MPDDKLTSQAEILNQVIASSFDGIYIVDINGFITNFNPPAERIFGYQLTEVVGKPVSDLYYSKNESNKIEVLLQESSFGKLTNYETFVIHKSGEKIPILLSATWLLDATDNKIGIVGYFKDLRFLREVERHRQLLLEANNAVARASSLDQGLNNLARIMVESCVTTFCYIMILSSDGNLAAKAAYPVSRGEKLVWDPKIRWSVDGTPRVSELVKIKKPVVFRANDEHGNQMLQHLAHEVNLQEQIQSMLVVPIAIDKKVIGLCFLGEMRNWDRSPFTERKIELVCSLASQAAVLIEKQQRFEESERQRHLLAALDEASQHIRAFKETSKLLHEFVRLAAELMNCVASCLYLNHSNLGYVELVAAYGIHKDLLGRSLLYNKSFIGSIVNTGQTKLAQEFSEWPDLENTFISLDIKIVVGVPLRHVGEIEAILLVADKVSGRLFSRGDIEILERFAAQASIALHTSNLFSREQRMFSQLTILNHITNYIQKSRDLEEIFHLVLTGITSSYGLGFNRAALFLFDDQKEALKGRMGIGFLDEVEARTAWESHQPYRLVDFKLYLEALENGTLSSTPVNSRIRALKIPLKSLTNDLQIMILERKSWPLIIEDDLDRIPTEFIYAFEPGRPLVAAPLIARDSVIGIVFVDNKFTQTPITEEDTESLMAFVNTAAVAINNAQLYDEAETARKRLHSLYEASNMLALSTTTDRVLKDIVTQAQVAAGADWVSVVLVDEKMERATNPFATRTESQLNTKEVIYDDSITKKVMRTGKPEIIQDMEKWRGIVNPKLFSNNVSTALCLPLSLQGKRIGVMWICYSETRNLPEFEIDALQLYANQAAIAYYNSQRMEELEQMQNAADALAGADRLVDVMIQIVESAREVLKADSVAICPYNPIQDRFTLDDAIATGIPTEIWDQIRQDEYYRKQTSSAVMRQGSIEVLDISDRENYQYLGDSIRNLLSLGGIQSFQGVALVVGKECLGILYANYNYQRNFSKEERETARTFANHAALALKKARLLEQVQSARSSAALIAQVTTTVDDLESSLNSVVQQIAIVLGADVVTLYPCSPETPKNDYPPVMLGIHDKELIRRYSEIRKGSAIWKILDLDHIHIAEDAMRDSVMQGSFIRKEQIKSCVGIPLKVKGKPVGVMFVNFRSNHRFTEDEISTIELFSNQAAVAIHNAQQFEALKELDRRKTEFLSTVSHELRTPLTPVQITLENMLDGVYGELDKKQRLRLEMALSSTQDETRLIDNLLNLVRIQENTVSLELENGSISEIIHDIVNIFEYDADKKQIAIKKELPDKDSLEAIIDVGKIKQVLTNLVHNALKFTPDDGTITIRASRQDQLILIEVEDTGCGIPESEFEKIFDRFYQIDSSLTRSIGGTGLGLNIAKEYVEMHDGRIWVESIEKKGSSFFFTLPDRRNI